MHSIHNVVLTLRTSEPSSFRFRIVASAIFGHRGTIYGAHARRGNGPAGLRVFGSEKRDLNERPADFLISRKMESFSLHAHLLSRAVIKQIEPLPSRRNKPHRPIRPLSSPTSPPLLLPPVPIPSRPLPKSRNLNKFTSVCTRINFTSFLAPLPLFLFLSLLRPSLPAARLLALYSGARKSFRLCPCGFSFATVPMNNQKGGVFRGGSPVDSWLPDERRAYCSRR